MSQLTVIHLVDEYLPRSQAFIYHYLSAMRITRPVVITQSLSNRHLFPLDDINVVRQPDLMRRLRRRLLLRLAVDVFPLTGQYTRIVQEHRGAVIHAHFGHVGYRSLALKHQTGLPLVTTFYGFDMSLLPRRRVWQRAFPALFAEGDRFLVEGPHMAESLERLGCPREKIVMQHIAVDLSRVRFAARDWDGRSTVRILMVGRFVEKKGFTYAIQAFARIAARWPLAELRIIGEGPLRKRLQREIASLGLSGRICLLGPKDYAAYLAEADQAHLFLSPSVTSRNGDTEGGAPTTLLEMQAAGLPVVSTLHADIPHVVNDGLSGFLVPERDVDALAERLDWLLSHPETWPAMGQAGREFMLATHNIHLEVARLEDLYLKLIFQDGLNKPAACARVQHNVAG